jgi:hypothetical protein
MGINKIYKGDNNKTYKGDNLKEFRDMKFIINRYPLSSKIIYGKAKKLILPEYEGLWRILKFGKIVIHESILDRLFLSFRLPNKNQPNHIRKWVRLHTWDYLGNLTPINADIHTNVELINEFSNVLKKMGDFIIFYSVESSPQNDNSFHTHFLIQSKDDFNRKDIWDQIKENPLLYEFLKDEVKVNPKFWFDSYDDKYFNDRGVKYTLKYEIKCGLTKHRKRKKKVG